MPRLKPERKKLPRTPKPGASQEHGALTKETKVETQFRELSARNTASWQPRVQKPEQIHKNKPVCFFPRIKDKTGLRARTKKVRESPLKAPCHYRKEAEK